MAATFDLIGQILGQYELRALLGERRERCRDAHEGRVAGLELGVAAELDVEALEDLLLRDDGLERLVTRSGKAAASTPQTPIISK